MQRERRDSVRLWSAPATEQEARTKLTAVWFGLLTINLGVVLGEYLLGGFGKLREPGTEQTLLKAFDGILFIFAPNLTAIGTYWYALRHQQAVSMRNPTAYYLSLYSSLLWGGIMTAVHIAGGAATYENTLPPLAMHSNWLISGTLGYYFATSK